jgi:hypothetical protein
MPDSRLVPAQSTKRRSYGTVTYRVGCSIRSWSPNELSGGEVLGFEIKAAASVGRDSARHLTWLRDQLGDRFLHGFVLHAGPGLFELDDRITAAPIGSLWS